MNSFSRHFRSGLKLFFAGGHRLDVRQRHGGGRVRPFRRREDHLARRVRPL